MSDEPKVYTYPSLDKVVTRLRDDFNSQDVVLLYAHNGTGKTRLSMAFKDARRVGDLRHTLYFNAYTEDLFSWDNDRENDTTRVLKFDGGSRFLSGIQGLSLEAKIAEYLDRYSTFRFDIQYAQQAVIFSRDEATNIKISRGEENLFIWCLFLAICELVVDEDQSYDWVKYVFIDDPISSLDDNNTIAVASDLAQLIRRGKDKVKFVISSHHSLFFNVMHNQLRSSNAELGSKSKCKSYYYHRESGSGTYTLRATDETPFFHHVAMLAELHHASESGVLYTHHFNILRSILEKTASFFGHDDFSACIHGVDDEVLFARALNLLSHGKYSIYEPKEMVEDTKELFQRILRAFLERYEFHLPAVLGTGETGGAS